MTKLLSMLSLDPLNAKYTFPVSLSLGEINNVSLGSGIQVKGEKEDGEFQEAWVNHLVAKKFMDTYSVS